MESLLLYKIASALIVPAILGLVKLYSDVKVLDNEVKNLNEELQDYKKHNSKDIEGVYDRIEKRLDKMESLIEKLFTYEREK